jgi:hypothetical protein
MILIQDFPKRRKEIITAWIVANSIITLVVRLAVPQFAKIFLTPALDHTIVL